MKHLPPPRSRLADSAFRSATALLRSRALKTSFDEIIKAECPGDKTFGLITKATTAPATMTAANWAEVLVGTGVADYRHGDPVRCFSITRAAECWSSVQFRQHGLFEYADTVSRLERGNVCRRRFTDT